MRYYTFQSANNKGIDQIAQACAFVVRMQQRQVFSRRCPYKMLHIIWATCACMQPLYINHGWYPKNKTADGRRFLNPLSRHYIFMIVSFDCFDTYVQVHFRLDMARNEDQAG